MTTDILSGTGVDKLMADLPTKDFRPKIEPVKPWSSPSSDPIRDIQDSLAKHLGTRVETVMGDYVDLADSGPFGNGPVTCGWCGRQAPLYSMRQPRDTVIGVGWQCASEDECELRVALSDFTLYSFDEFKQAMFGEK